jgi:hypothetical protein
MPSATGIICTKGDARGQESASHFSATPRWPLRREQGEIRAGPPRNAYRDYLVFDHNDFLVAEGFVLVVHDRDDKRQHKSFTREDEGVRAGYDWSQSSRKKHSPPARPPFDCSKARHTHTQRSRITRQCSTRAPLTNEAQPAVREQGGDGPHGEQHHEHKAQCAEVARSRQSKVPVYRCVEVEGHSQRNLCGLILVDFEGPGPVADLLAVPVLHEAVDCLPTGRARHTRTLLAPRNKTALSGREEE